LEFVQDGVSGQSLKLVAKQTRVAKPAAAAIGDVDLIIDIEGDGHRIPPARKKARAVFIAIDFPARPSPVVDTPL
jgi:hypothetical protein